MTKKQIFNKITKLVSSFIDCGKPYAIDIDTINKNACILCTPNEETYFNVRIVSWINGDATFIIHKSINNEEDLQSLIQEVNALKNADK